MPRASAPPAAAVSSCVPPVAVLPAPRSSRCSKLDRLLHRSRARRFGSCSGAISSPRTTRGSTTRSPRRGATRTASRSGSITSRTSSFRRGWPPNTWELARVAARTMKPKGHPTGIQFSQCADANLNWRSVLFSFGGAELDPSGENILIDSKETREALRFAKALFDEGMTPEVFSWDDASDNRFLASGVGCWIHDAISAYRTTEDTNPDVFKNTYIGMEPAGPGGKRVST